MTKPGETSPGGGLWSTTGIAPPSPTEEHVSFSVTDQHTVGHIPGFSRQDTPAAHAKGRKPWTCPRCKCCYCCPCAQCCCPCTCCRCFCWLCAIIVLFVLAIGILALIVWKVFHPKIPTFNVENVQFQYNVTGAAATNASSASGPSSYVLNAETKFVVQTTNPNTKIGIYYDQIKLNVQILSLVIGNQIIPAFYDGFNVTKYINGDMISGAVSLSAANQAALLAAESIGKVPLNLNVDVKVRAKIGYLVTPQLKVGLRCLLTVDPGITSGSQVTGTTCKFKFF